MTTELKESEDYPGFFEIPNYNNYVISKDGRVLNIISKVFLSGSKNPDGYINIRLTNERGTLTWGLHRLLCYVFKNPGTDIIDLVVNHKNGIKDSNDLDNLEWNTYQQNSEHAGLNGLTTKCLSVSIKNINTGEILKFPSFIKCATFLGVSKDTVNWRVKAGEHRLFSDGYQYRLGTDDDEWVKINITNTDYISQNKSKPIIVRYLISDRIKVFRSSSEFSKEFDVSQATVSNWLDLKGQPVLPGLIQLKYLSDPSPWRVVEDKYGELEFFTKERCISVTHVFSGEEKYFTSGIECCKEMCLKPSTLNYRLKSNGSKVFSDGYRYKYVNVV